MAANSDGDENMGSPDPTILDRLDELGERINATLASIAKFQEETDKKMAAVAKLDVALPAAIQWQKSAIQRLGVVVAEGIKDFGVINGLLRERMAVLEHRCDVIDKRNDESRDAKVVAGILAEIKSKT